jgi:P27 family predicted phage terminase small subunit
MAFRGRRPTPTHLKLLRGVPGHHPLNKHEPEPSASVEPPPAPDFLSDYARAEWDRIAVELYRLKLLTVVDIAPLAAYCESYSVWRTSVEKLKEMAARDPAMSGLLVKTRHDSVMQNPLCLTMRQAASDMVRYASEFGFTPAARSRINIVEAQPVPGKFDGLLA